jgi:hypothetical protein
MMAGLIDEVVIIDLLALFLAIATVEIIWYVVKKAFPDEVRDLRFFVTFIVVIVPFVVIVCFGLAIINYDAMAIRSGWPPALPLHGLLSPPMIGVLIFYVGQTAWLWSSWRNE